MEPFSSTEQLAKLVAELAQHGQQNREPSLIGRTADSINKIFAESRRGQDIQSKLDTLQMISVNPDAMRALRIAAANNMQGAEHLQEMVAGHMKLAIDKAITKASYLMASNPTASEEALQRFSEVAGYIMANAQDGSLLNKAKSLLEAMNNDNMVSIIYELERICGIHQQQPKGIEAAPPRGSISANHNQFNIPGGKEFGISACTPASICAASALLNVPSFDRVTPALLDDVLIKGIQLYKDSGGRAGIQLNIQQVRHPPTIQPHGKSLWGSWSPNANRKNYPLTSPQELVDASLKSAESMPFAVVITKPPETICLVVRSPKEFWIFDSHGGGDNNAACVKAFTSSEAVKGALNSRFWVDEDLRDVPDYCNFGAVIFVPTAQEMKPAAAIPVKPIQNPEISEELHGMVYKDYPTIVHYYPGEELMPLFAREYPQFVEVLDTQPVRHLVEGKADEIQFTVQLVQQEEDFVDVWMHGPLHEEGSTFHKAKMGIFEGFNLAPYQQRPVVVMKQDDLAKYEPNFHPGGMGDENQSTLKPVAADKPYGGFVVAIDEKTHKAYVSLVIVTKGEPVTDFSKLKSKIIQDRGVPPAIKDLLRSLR